MASLLAPGSDGAPRCWWGSGGDSAYERYHDDEWGRPVTEDRGLFEKIVLEGFQAGLAWITILRKRDAFREVFAGFDPDRVAAFEEPDVERLLGDARIVRHRGKIEAAISNAGRAREAIDEFGSLAAFFWPHAGEHPAPVGEIPATTPGSTALAKDLKRRGWRFVGPTTVYAFMQAMGLVNDHVAGCLVRDEVEVLRRPVLEQYRG